MSIPFRYPNPVAPPVIVTTARCPRKISLARPDAVVLSTTSRTISRGRIVVKPGPVQFEGIYAILAARGRPVCGSELAGFIWGDREDGGPDYADGNLGTMIRHFRRKLLPLGVGVQAGYGSGFSAVDLHALDNQQTHEAA